ncbi:zinc-binding dehydrogenase [Actinoallomurus iriomotensis]|uniref:NADPH:quinone reductase n=1 Tax=Actinoallomurus iriomotensis TaxID=478107 RepID=A0A9W6RVJ8_9ACTN|nr:zinc-binding dehydrogenase [Actinoallomurus iriomotensis]GLY80937.1 NADPH:quinone reductase [Actinoallomurus iriomotensis]
MRVVRVREFGTPEVLRVEEMPEPEPGAGQVVVAVETAGVGYGDVIVRSGGYPFPLPYVPGLEVGGQVVAVGPGTDRSLLGRRVVATTVGNTGGYGERALAPAAWTFPVPNELALPVALAVFQAGAVASGMLAAMRVRDGETVLITAAAGRIGSLLVQLAKAAGATVIGAAGADKAAAVEDFGADHAVDYGAGDWPDRVRALSGGGVDVVLDAIGGEIGAQALEAAADGRGRFGIYGFASGAWLPLDAQVLARRGLTVAGPLGAVFAKPDAEQRDDAERALAAAADGRLRPRIHATYPLDRAADAHAEIERRRSVGAVLLAVPA